MPITLRYAYTSVINQLMRLVSLLESEANDPVIATSCFPSVPGSEASFYSDTLILLIKPIDDCSVQPSSEINNLNMHMPNTYY